MKNLSLHSSGKADYLKLLKETYKRLALELKNNPELSQAEKQAAFKLLNKKFKHESNNAEFSLFASK